jgi:hypothetical protein
MLSSIARFMPTIWNSYSKSETARSPRMITCAPTSAAHWISRFSNGQATISTPASRPIGAHSASIIATRSSSVKSGPLSRLMAMPITSRSMRAQARRMMSVCPKVTGSKVPG